MVLIISFRLQFIAPVDELQDKFAEHGVSFMMPVGRFCLYLFFVEEENKEEEEIENKTKNMTENNCLLMCITNTAWFAVTREMLLVFQFLFCSASSVVFHFHFLNLI